MIRTFIFRGRSRRMLMRCIKRGRNISRESGFGRKSKQHQRILRALARREGLCTAFRDHPFESHYAKVSMVRRSRRRDRGGSLSVAGRRFRPRPQQLSHDWTRLTMVKLMQVSFGGHVFLFVNPITRANAFPLQPAAGCWNNHRGEKACLAAWRKSGRTLGY